MAHAAGAPPDDFAGDRPFNADQAGGQLGVPAVAGDQAAINLQTLHFLRHLAHVDDRAMIDDLAERQRLLLVASDASHAREAETRELHPVTRVPDAPWGANANVANIRMHNIPIFTGSNSDTIDVVQWVSRIFNLAAANNLTYAAAITLLIQGSSKGAANYIEEMREEGKTLPQIIQQLEMRYGSLTTVEDARVKCNTLPRKPNEGLSDFIDRLRMLARMACRKERNEDVRRRMMDNLVEGNIRRVLPSSVRNQLEERILSRSRIGLPAFTAREIERECLDLENRRTERKQELAPRKQNIRQVEVANDDSELDSSGLSSDDDQEEESAADYLINEVKQQQQKYYKRNIQPDNKRIWKRAVKNYNEKFQRRPNYGKAPQFGARQAAGAGGLLGLPAPRQQGPPNKMEGHKPIHELLNLANCTKGQCIQCGADGHMMRNIQCALKDKQLVDRACAKCGKGLHGADDCPKVFQQGYVAPAPTPAVEGNAAQVKEPLNG